MKHIISLFSLVLFVALGCNTDKKTTAETEDTTTADSVVAESPTSVTWIVDTKASQVEWKGTKPTGEHIGTIAIKEGSLSTEDNKVASGNFVMDMTTITETTNADKPKMQKKLTDDLKSSNFFSVDSFPLSTFAITKVEGDVIHGNLTIKNVTKGIKFPANVTINGATLNASTAFDIDRTAWGITYDVGKKVKGKIIDKIISDVISYKITLVAYKQ